jgi:hypothetical protein
MAVRLFVVLCLAALPACSLARDVTPGARAHDGDIGDFDSGLAPHDAGPRQDGAHAEDDAYVAPGIDAYVAPGVDAYVAPGVDAYVVPPDAWVAPDAYSAPDAWVGVDAWSGARSCDAIYGGVDGYHGCVDNPTTCEFVTTLYVTTTCRARCESNGGTCVDAENNSGSDGCTHGGSANCDTYAWDLICICSHPS